MDGGESTQLGGRAADSLERVLFAMAMKKADMESHRDEYYARISKARSALSQGHYHQAVQFACSSWDFVDGMMQYERKYEDREFKSIEGIDIVLDYAPLLFDVESLDGLETLLRTQRRIDRNASDDLADKLAKARFLMWEAHRAWSHLENVQKAMQDRLHGALGGDANVWRYLVKSWEQMGLVHRESDGQVHQVALATQMDLTVSGKCPSCGAVGKARKAKFLESVACPKCSQQVHFVILATESTI
jgi:hypothetical protein